MRTKDPNNDWLLGSLMETLRTKCIEHCGKSILSTVPINRFYLIKSAFVLVKKPNEFHPKCAICKDVIHDIKNKIENSPAEVRLCCTTACFQI